MAQARPLSSTIFFSRGGKGCLTDWSGVLDIESNATLQFTLHYSTSASKPPQFSSFPAVFLLPARHGDIGEGQKPPAKREAMSRNKLNWQPTAQGTNSTERAEERHSRAIILTGGVTERLPTPAALRAQRAPRGSAAAAAQPRAALRSAAPPARGFSAPRAAKQRVLHSDREAPGSRNAPLVAKHAETPPRPGPRHPRGPHRVRPAPRAASRRPVAHLMTTRLPFTSTLSRVSLLERDMVTASHRCRPFPTAAARALPRHPSAPPLRRPSRPRPLLIGPTRSATCSYWTSFPPVSYPPAPARGRAAAEAWSRPARSRRRVRAAQGEKGLRGRSGLRRGPRSRGTALK